MLKGPISKATISTSMILSLKLVVQAGSLWIIARLLGPDEFGLFAGVAALAVLMGTFSTFGMHLVLLAKSSKNRASGSEVLSYALPTTILMGFLIFFFYYFLVHILFNNSDLMETVFLCIGITEILLLPLHQLVIMRVMAEEKVALSQILVIFPLALRMLSAVFVLYAGFQQPLYVFSYLYLITAGFSLVFIWLYEADRMKINCRWRLASRKELKNSAGYATLALTASGAGELDKIVAVKLMNSGMGSLYVIASRTIGAAILPVIALLLSALPRLFRNSINSSENNRKLIKCILIVVVIYSFFLMVSVWFISPALEWVFGFKYYGLENLLKLVCFAIPGFAIRVAVGSILMTMNRPWYRAGFEVLGIATFILLSFGGMRYFEEYSVIIALIFSEWFMALMGLYFLFRDNES